MAETKTLEIRTGRSRPVGIWHLFAGIIMAALGVYVWFNPVATMVALALYIGIIFIILGAGYITASFRYDSGWDMFVGVLDILVGIIFVGNLGVSASSMPIILPCGAWRSALFSWLSPISFARRRSAGAGL